MKQLKDASAKNCEYKNEDSSPNTQSDKNYQVSSQKFKQITKFHQLKGWVIEEASPQFHITSKTCLYLPLTKIYEVSYFLCFILN